MPHVDARLELGALGGEEGLDVAHVGVLREQARRRGVVGRHVGDPQHEHEIGAGTNAPALLHRGVGDGDRLERIEVLGDVIRSRSPCVQRKVGPGTRPLYTQAGNVTPGATSISFSVATS